MTYSLLEVVLKLIGSVHPVGDESIDPQRFENMRELCKLVTSLVMIIEQIADDKNRQEHSLKKAGEYASEFLLTLK